MCGEMKREIKYRTRKASHLTNSCCRHLAGKIQNMAPKKAVKKQEIERVELGMIRVFHGAFSKRDYAVTRDKMTTNELIDMIKADLPGTHDSTSITKSITLKQFNAREENYDMETLFMRNERYLLAVRVVRAKVVEEPVKVNYKVPSSLQHPEKPLEFAQVNKKVTVAFKSNKVASEQLERLVNHYWLERIFEDVDPTEDASIDITRLTPALRAYQYLFIRHS